VITSKVNHLEHMCILDGLRYNNAITLSRNDRRLKAVSVTASFYTEYVSQTQC